MEQFDIFLKKICEDVKKQDITLREAISMCYGYLHCMCDLKMISDEESSERMCKVTELIVNTALDGYKHDARKWEY